MPDRTSQQVLRQLDAMACGLYEVGIGVPKGSALAATNTARMEIKTWNVEQVLHSLSWLKHQNAQGFDLYVRPNAADGAQHSLSMIDDLSPDALNTMVRTGYQPSVVVETSPGNHQAWLNHGQVLDHQRSTEAARNLATRFGGDLGAADYRHFGRVAGFTNRKDKHLDIVTGYHPYVQLHVAIPGGRVYDRAPEVLRAVDRAIAENLKREQRYIEYWKQHGPDRVAHAKTIEHFRSDPRYGGDHHREDYAFALYGAGVAGLAKDEVRRQLASRDDLVKKKGGVHGAERYLDKTIDEAYAKARDLGMGLGR